jgi:hypothetical protein
VAVSDTGTLLTTDIEHSKDHSVFPTINLYEKIGPLKLHVTQLLFEAEFKLAPWEASS